MWGEQSLRVKHCSSRLFAVHSSSSHYHSGCVLGPCARCTRRTRSVCFWRPSPSLHNQGFRSRLCLLFLHRFVSPCSYSPAGNALPRPQTTTALRNICNIVLFPCITPPTPLLPHCFVSNISPHEQFQWLPFYRAARGADLHIILTDPVLFKFKLLSIIVSLQP